MRMAFILVLLGYGTKAGLAPMHTWKPDAYSEAPVPVGRDPGGRHAELRALRTGPVLRADQPLPGRGVSGKPAAAARLFSMGIAVPFVLVQKNFRRMLAYSTIDQAGIMVTALGIGGKLGRVCADAAHDVSYGGQVAAVPFRRQYLSVLQDRPIPEAQGRRARAYCR